MKKVALPLLLLVLSVSACKKDPTKTVVGKWRLDKATYTALDNSNVLDDTPTGPLEYVYEKDGRGWSEFGNEKGFPFQWYLSEDLAQITFVSQSGHGSSYDVETLSNEQMILSQITQIDTTSTEYTYRAEYAKIGK